MNENKIDTENTENTELTETKVPDNGMYHEEDTYRIDINYSPEAVEKELIKITIKEGDSIELPANSLLGAITSFIKNKDLALALSSKELEMKSVAMCDITRTFNFTATKDIKEGEQFSFNVSQKYPYFLALLEEGYKIAHIEGNLVYVPLEDVESARQQMMERNRELAEAINNQNIPNTEK